MIQETIVDETVNFKYTQPSETHYEEKLEQFIEEIVKTQPDIIAMQEVNQSISAPSAGPELLSGFFLARRNPSLSGKITMRHKQPNGFGHMA